MTLNVNIVKFFEMERFVRSLGVCETFGNYLQISTQEL